METCVRYEKFMVMFNVYQLLCAYLGWFLNSMYDDVFESDVFRLVDSILKQNILFTIKC